MHSKLVDRVITVSSVPRRLKGIHSGLPWKLSALSLAHGVGIVCILRVENTAWVSPCLSYLTLKTENMPPVLNTEQHILETKKYKDTC